MSVDSVKQRIEWAMDHERTTHAFARMVASSAWARDVRATAQQIQQAVGLVAWQVELTPSLIDDATRRASRTAAGQLVAPALRTAIEYFEEPNDILSDHLGLGGLVDDCYVAIALVGLASETHRHQTGHALVYTDQSVAVAHQFMGALLGPQIRGQLHRIITARAPRAPSNPANAALNEQLLFAMFVAAAAYNVSSSSGGPPLKYKDPLNGRSPDEHAKEMSALMLPSAY